MKKIVLELTITPEEARAILDELIDERDGRPAHYTRPPSEREADAGILTAFAKKAIEQRIKESVRRLGERKAIHEATHGKRDRQ